MNGRKIFGIFLMLFGAIMLVSTFTTDFLSKKFEKKLPDGVKKYDAEDQREYEEMMNGNNR